MIREIINVIMGIVYLFLGGFILDKNWLIVDLNLLAGRILATLFMVYGVFRIYRGIQALRSKNY